MPDGEALPWNDAIKFVDRLVALARADLATARQPQTGWTFFDRGLIDALIASAHANSITLARPPEAAQFNRLVFLAPPWLEIYRNDAERKHSFEEAVSEYDRLIAAYPALGFDVAVLPKSSISTRADFVCRALAEQNQTS